MACNRWALGDWGAKLPRPVGDAYLAHRVEPGSVVATQHLAEEFSLRAFMPLIGHARE